MPLVFDDEQSPASAPASGSGRLVFDDEAPKSVSKSRSAADFIRDTGASFLQGAVDVNRAISNVGGADNIVSEKLGELSSGIDKNVRTEAGRARRQEHQRLSEEAANRGMGAEAWQAVKNFTDGPESVADYAAQGLGSVAGLYPAMKTAGITAVRAGLGALGARIATGAAVGVPVGVGATKGSQYEESLQYLQGQGVPEARAKELASQAQAYGKDNALQHVIGGGLGVVDVLTGGEAAMLGKNAIAGRIKNMAKRGAEEFGTEMVQGGHEKFAGNLAAIDVGDESRNPMRGVVGAGVQEGLMGMVAGAGTGAFEQAKQTAAAQDQTPLPATETGITEPIPDAMPDAMPAQELVADEPQPTATNTMGVENGATDPSWQVSPVAAQGTQGAGTDLPRSGVDSQPGASGELAGRSGGAGISGTADGSAIPAGSAGVPGVTAPDTTAADALMTPKAITALDRVAELDTEATRLQAREAELSADNGYGEMFNTERQDVAARRAELAKERESITASWPKSITGQPTSFSTEAGVRLEAQYALMDAGELTTSHDENLRPTPTYPPELQPRQRDRAASEMQIAGIVQRLDPARLGESADAANGAPIVGADGLVESGNARTIALKRIYQAKGQRADEYKQFLKDNAQRFGLAPEQIDGMAAPVLVRVRTTPVNRAEFARQANAATVAQMSPSEQAKSDAARIDSLEGLNPDDNGDFMTGTSRDFVRGFMARIPGTEQSGMIDAAGNLSQTGYTRMRNAVLAKAYGDSPVLLRMVESLDDNIRNLSKSLIQAAPTVAKARQSIQEGLLFDSDITPDLLAAVEELSRLKDDGKSVHDALAQAGMFGEQYSPETRELLQFLADNIRRPRKIAEFIKSYFEGLNAAGNPNQGSLLGDTAAPAKGDLMNAARRNQDGTEGISQDRQTGEQGGEQRKAAPGNQTGTEGDQEDTGPAESAAAVAVDAPAVAKTDEVDFRKQRYRNINDAEKAIKKFGMKKVGVFKDGDQFKIDTKPGAKSEDFSLTGETPEQVKAKEEVQAAKAKAEQEAADKAEAEAKKKRIATEVESRQAASAENLVLGQNAEDALAGQGDLLSAPINEKRTDSKWLSDDEQRAQAEQDYNADIAASGKVRQVRVNGEAEMIPADAVEHRKTAVTLADKSARGLSVGQELDLYEKQAVLADKLAANGWTNDQIAANSLNMTVKAYKEQVKGGFYGKDYGLDVERLARARSTTAKHAQSKLKRAPRTKKAESLNTVFTEDAAAAARAVLKKKLGQLNTGIDPEIMQAGITLAGYHIEKGARTFAAYAKAMLEDLGDAVKPYLKSWYAAVSLDPRATGFNGMDDLATVQTADLDAILKETGDTNEPDQRSSTDLERNRQDARTQDGMGEEVVRNDSGSDGGTGKQGILQPDKEGSGKRSERVPGRETVASGTQGDLSPFADAAGTEDGIAGSGLDQRSSDLGFDGQTIEPAGTEATDSTAQGGIGLSEKRQAQVKAQAVKVVPGNRANIAESLPFLLEGQKDDVAFAENRFSKPNGYGVLFTNGTGTGKTFSGLGVIKRFERQGKSNILIVVPSDKISSDWVNAGRELKLDITGLADTQDAGKGIVITTYANMGANNALVNRKWDLIVADESHYMMQAKDGGSTNALDNLRAITMHPRGQFERHSRLHAKEIARLKQLSDKITSNNRIMNLDDTMDQMRYALQDENAKMQAEADKLTVFLREKQEQVKVEVEAAQGIDRTRAVFLSATPFAYEKTVDYAEGYLFNYAPEDTRGGYNSGSPFDRFMMQHFGYRMKYNKLNEPGPEVNRGLMQRAFNSWLKSEKVLSGRMLDVEHDYDRKFILVDSAIGAELDRAMQWIWDRAYDQANQNKEGYSMLQSSLAEKFDHLARRYLLEAIKAKEAIPIIRAHLDMGRKVVVFHDFKKGGGFNPLRFGKGAGTTDDAKAYNAAIDAFNAEFADLIESPMWGAESPIDALSAAFQDALLFNGDVPAKKRRENATLFNDDNSGNNLIIGQSAAMKEGVSLHDTTGKHQRVLINLGLPTQPTTAIQQEGRIFRVGQASNAIFRYLNTGTNWERFAFATSVAQRASAAENLAVGEEARALMDAFIEGFEESDTYAPGHEGEGTGGKARDKAANQALTEWDRAMTLYWAQQKKTSRTKALEGVDYFATPEPLGLKMVEWADIRDGDKALEPSAGHGAIARWFPDNIARTVVEPSSELASRLKMVVGDARLLQEQFEQLDAAANKYDAVVMNPPFGSGGKTAVDHVAKAAKHLNNGGRIVALIPTGSAADKKFDKWFYDEEQKAVKPLAEHPTLGPIYKGDVIETNASWMKRGKVMKRDQSGNIWLKGDMPGVTMANQAAWNAVVERGPRTESFRPAADLYLRADIKLPQVTFERAGTRVAARVVVIEKQTDKDAAAKIQQVNRDYSDSEDIKDFFSRIKESSMPARAMPATSPAAAPEPAVSGKAKPAAEGKKLETDAEEITYTTKKGKVLNGVIAKGITEAQAKEYDLYTWKKDGGFFIRMEHVQRPGEAPKLSRNPGAGIPKPAAQSIADRIAAANKNMPKVRVFASPADLDRNIQTQAALYAEIESAGALSDVEGAAHDGEIYLFSDHLADDTRAEHVLAIHEVTHHGLRKVFGAELNPILQSIWNNNTNVRKRAAALGERLGLKSNTAAVEEVLADMQPADLVKLKGWRKLVQFMRDWFQNHGFTGLAGKLDGMLKAGMTDQQQADMLVADVVNAARDWVNGGKQAGKVGGGTMLQRVYHGTPHLWNPEPGFPHGRPRLDKIGTGEGAQAFGWGWYSAESKGVAEDYAKKLSNGSAPLNFDGISPKSGPFGPKQSDIGDFNETLRREIGLSNIQADAITEVIDGDFKSVDEAIETFKKNAETSKETWRKDYYIEISEIIDRLRNRFGIVDNRNLYQLDIPDAALPYLLDWDKQYEDQTEEVRAAWDASVEKYPIPRRISGRAFYAAISVDTGSDKAASEYLASLGIVGNRYLDGQSRKDGEGSYNYVIWDQPTLDKIAMLERNGEKLDAMREADVMLSRASQSPLPGVQQSPPVQPPSQQSANLQGGSAVNQSVFNTPEPSKMDDIIFKLQDKHIDLKRAIQGITDAGRQIADKWNTYMQEELFHGRSAKRVKDFTDRELAPMLREMALRKVSIADLDKFLWARHAKEANALIEQRDPGVMVDDVTGKPKGSGMTDQEADDYFASLSQDQRNQLDAIAKKVDDMLVKTRELYVSYGLEGRDTVQGWADMFQHYVPLMREDHDGGMGIGQGFSIKGRETKHRTGSTRAVADVLANIATQRERAIVRGEKNRVAVSLAGLVKLNPAPDFWTLDKIPQERVLNEKTGQVETREVPNYRTRDNVIIAKIKDGNGNVKERAIVLNERDERAVRLAKSMKNIDIPMLEGWLGSAAAVTRYFSAINTQYNPVFGAINLIRDVGAGALNLSSTALKGKERIVTNQKRIASAVAGIYSDARKERKGQAGTSAWSQLWEDFTEQGGQTGYRDMFKTSNDRADAMQMVMDPTSWTESKWGKFFTANGALKVPLLTAQKAATPLFNWLSDYNLAMENAVRLSAYKEALDSGMSKPQAASLAKNLTVNFNRKGAYGAQAGALYAFFNAATQGSARIGETLTRRDHVTGKYSVSDIGKKIIGGGIMLGAMQAVALAMAGFDDDEPPEFIRERNIVVPLPGGKYLAIPMPLGFHVIPNIGRITAETVMGRRGSAVEAVIDLAGITFEAFNPIGSAGWSMQTVAPTVLDPMAALIENKDWTGKPIAKEKFSDSDPTPGFDMARDNASAIATGIAYAINLATGGSDYTAGRISPTPDQLDYLWGQVTGGVGREFNKLYQTVESPFTGEELPPYKIPLAGRLYGDTQSKSAVSSRYYENIRDMKRHKAEYLGRRENGDAEGAREYLADNPEAKLFRAVGAYESKIQQLRSAKRKAVERGINPDRVKAIEQRTSELMDKFNQQVESAQQ